MPGHGSGLTAPQARLARDKVFDHGPGNGKPSRRARRLL